MIIKVRCSFVIDVEVPDDDPDYDVEFDIEDNHCPGTGRVGAALDAHIEKCDAEGFCWACNLKGKNEIVRDEPKVIDVLAQPGVKELR